jgi:hypothetical protein
MVNILVHMISNYSLESGGALVQYEFCRILDNLGFNVRMQAPERIENCVFSKWYNNEFDLNDTIVIYGETIRGNPLNAPRVVRWILAPVGEGDYPTWLLSTWGKNDLVYYFNSEAKIQNNPEKINSIYKFLSIMFIHPLIDNHNLSTRNGTCFAIRKHHYHGPSYEQFHPANSFEITREHTQEECIQIFNKHKYFISYDPLTFLSVIAALCGCISIVKKIDGISKADWLNTTAASEYLKEHNETMLYGVAYGTDDIHNAKTTLHMAKDQWTRILNYSINKNLMPFIKDINNWNNMTNTLQNNYY